MIPTAFTTAGGGFKAMTVVMGMIRAFYNKGILSEMTHFGAVSGGSWFQSQFSYSQDFYESVVGIGQHNSKTVQEVVGEWGRQYAQSMDEAVQQALVEDWRFSIGETSYFCALNTVDVNNKTLAEMWDRIFNIAIYDTHWPASDWYFYVANMLKPYIADVATTPFDSPRNGFPNGTLVIGTTLGPDVWDNTGGLEIRLDGLAVDVIPLAYYAPPGEQGEWKLPSLVPNPLEVSEGSGILQQTIDLNLSPGAGIAEVCAASSAAGGLTGSPTLMNRAVANAIEGLDIPNSTKSLLETAIDLCLPLGLQNISAPTDGDFSSNVAWTPKYRYLDGGYTDGTSVAHTIARMQFDCAGAELDCSDGIRVYQVASGARGQDIATPRLFANCNCGIQNEDLATGYNPQLFADDFPDNDDPGWLLYSNASYDFEAPLGMVGGLESWVWRGTITTVDNEAYGVTAGTKVDFIMFFITYPPQEVVIWPGYAAGYAFSSVYGLVAEEQFASVQVALEMIGSNQTTAAPTIEPTAMDTPGPTPSPTAAPTPGTQGTNVPTAVPTSGSIRCAGAYGVGVMLVSIGFVLLAG